MTAAMSPRPDRDAPDLLAAGASAALLVAGLYALRVSIENNPLEGWGMLLRAVAGHALLLGAVELGARAALGRPSPIARVVGALALSALLTPAAVFVLLMTRESGPSWSLAALALVAWFAASGVLALVAARRIP